ncbi:MAG: hypothetical protein RLZZ558_1849 [Planctomycetota bacterium]|jgi:hypothetical protein
MSKLFAPVVAAVAVASNASAAVVVFDDFSLDMNSDPSAIVTQAPAVWGDPLGSSLDRVMQGGNTGNISGGVWAPGFFDLLSYQSDAPGSGVDRTSYTGLYFDFVDAGSLFVSVGGSVLATVNGMANERVFLDFASLSGVDANDPDIVLINNGFGTSLSGFGFQVVPAPGAAGVLGLAGVMAMRRRR